MTPEPFEDYVKLNRLFASGDITKASRQELECYAVMLARPEAHTRIGGVNFPQMCETVRMLLILRVSEEAGRTTLLLTSIGLAVAVVALLWSVFMFAASK